MSDDDIRLVNQRLKKKEEQLKKAEESGDTKDVALLSTIIALIKLEIKYLGQGGSSLRAPDDLTELYIFLKAKKQVLEDFVTLLESLPENDVNNPKYQRIANILSTQAAYLEEKYDIISKNGSLEDLQKWMDFAGREGVDIIESALEHEASLKAFKPAKVEKRKKDFVPDFRKVAIALTVLLLMTSFYFGMFWRKTPYDRQIIRSYVVARNNYINANSLYVSGEYKGSETDYAIAAAFFNKAKENARLASDSKSGKMQEYFSYKGKFFEQWELISLEMAKSSREFQTGGHDVAASHAVTAVDLAVLAGQYNQRAEESWSLI